MSKYDIRPQFERQNRILAVKILYSASFECQDTILGPTYNVKKQKAKTEKQKTNTKSEKTKVKNE